MNWLVVIIRILVPALALLQAQTGRVRIRVTDAPGAAITTATAALVEANGSPIRTAQASSAGEIVLLALPSGKSRVTVKAPGFYSHQLTVPVRDENEQDLEVELQVDVNATKDLVMINASPLKPDDNPTAH